MVGQVRSIDLKKLNEIVRRSAEPHSDEAFVWAALVSEAHNKYDPNAVAVICQGAPVGYLPRKDAQRYRTPIGDLAERGLAVHVRARVWAGQSTSWDDPSSDYSTRSTASVRLALPEAHLLGPLNSVPTEPYGLLPYASAVQVTGEENHGEAIAPFLYAAGDCWAIATLHRVEVPASRGTKVVTEVRLDGASVGVLTPKMSSETLPAVNFLADKGAVTAVRARVRGNRIKAEVSLHCCRAHEIPDSWFDEPVNDPGDWAPFRSEEDARERVGERPARSSPAPQPRALKFSPSCPWLLKRIACKHRRRTGTRIPS